MDGNGLLRCYQRRSYAAFAQLWLAHYDESEDPDFRRIEDRRAVGKLTVLPFHAVACYPDFRSMLTIRPKEIFQRAPSTAPLTLDWPKAFSGCSILETCLLIAAGRIVNARKYFEFGTYLGRTTLNLMMNAHPEATITTLDLPAPIKSQCQGGPGEAEDGCISAHFAAGPMAWEGTPYESRITRLLTNSREWKYEGPEEDVDLVFIDGGHDPETLEADTENAMRMLKPGGVIAWHDYTNPNFPELSKWLNGGGWLNNRRLVHVAETLLVFHFDGMYLTGEEK